MVLARISYLSITPSKEMGWLAALVFHGKGKYNRNFYHRSTVLFLAAKVVILGETLVKTCPIIKTDKSTEARIPALYSAQPCRVNGGCLSDAKVLKLQLSPGLTDLWEYHLCKSPTMYGVYSVQD